MAHQFATLLNNYFAHVHQSSIKVGRYCPHNKSMSTECTWLLLASCSRPSSGLSEDVEVSILLVLQDIP